MCFMGRVDVITSPMFDVFIKITLQNKSCVLVAIYYNVNNIEILFHRSPFRLLKEPLTLLTCTLPKF